MERDTLVAVLAILVMLLMVWFASRAVAPQSPSGAAAANIAGSAGLPPPDRLEPQVPVYAPCLPGEQVYVRQNHRVMVVEECDARAAGMAIVGRVDEAKGGWA